MKIRKMFFKKRNEGLDVLLINPYDMVESNTERVGFPFGLFSIKSYLEDKGITAFIADMHHEKLRPVATLEFVLLYNPKIVGITTVSPTYKSSQRLAEGIKKIMPHIKVIVGGYDATDYSEDWIKKDYIDLVVKGEGEITMHQVADYYINNKGRLEDIDGIVFKKEGKIIQNKKRELIQNLDDLPEVSPKDQKRYVYKIPAGPSIRVPVARGCDYGVCSFCDIRTVHGTHSRTRSVDNIFNFMKRSLKEYPDTQVFKIASDNALSNPEIWSEVYDLMNKKNMEQLVVMELRADSIVNNEELIRKTASKMGGVNLGLETMHPSLLKRWNKGITPEINAKAMEILDSLNIYYFNYIISVDQDMTGIEAEENMRLFGDRKYKLWSKSYRLTNYLMKKRVDVEVNKLPESVQVYDSIIKKYDEIIVDRLTETYNLFNTLKSDEDKKVGSYIRNETELMAETMFNKFADAVKRVRLNSFKKHKRRNVRNNFGEAYKYFLRKNREIRDTAYEMIRKIHSS